MSEPTPMKAITLWQPWASMIAMGLKRYETRSWYTRHRGPLAIHAAQRQPSPAELAQYEDLLIGLLRPPLPVGKIVAICNLTNVLKISYYYWRASSLERRLGDFSLGRCAWQLQEVKPLMVPIPARGKQGLWNWTPPPDLEQLYIRKESNDE